MLAALSALRCAEGGRDDTAIGGNLEVLGGTWRVCSLIPLNSRRSSSAHRHSVFRFAGLCRRGESLQGQDDPVLRRFTGLLLT